MKPFTLTVETADGGEHAVAVAVGVGFTCFEVGVGDGNPVGDGVAKIGQMLIDSSAKPWVGVGPAQMPTTKPPKELSPPKHPPLFPQLDIMLPTTRITTGETINHLIQRDIEP
ncbi:MAG TPA: hypothetical protein VNF29_02150 [Candidatus Binataceae bacterium]|nr:hypothetical protein [Candidatus Binataceae bacterium]